MSQLSLAGCFSVGWDTLVFCWHLPPVRRALCSLYVVIAAVARDRKVRRREGDGLWGRHVLHPAFTLSENKC